MANDDLMAHYSRALDEVYFLRCLLEYESGVIDAHLGFKTFPKSRRAIAERQSDRMERAADGEAREVYKELHAESLAFRRMVGSRTLTRDEWERPPVDDDVA